MSLQFDEPTNTAPNVQAGAMLVGVGLVLLIAGSCWPHALVVTAMAIIAVGATELTLARFRATPVLFPVLIVHGATYLGLYGLFIGATLHAASLSAAAGLSTWAVLDLAISVAPMAVVLRRFARCCCGSR